LKETDKEIIYGNSENYDLSKIEATEQELLDIDSDDDTPLFRKEPSSEGESDESDEDSEVFSDDDESDLEGVHPLNQDLYEDLKKPDKKRKGEKQGPRVTKKQRRKKYEQDLEEFEEEEQKKCDDVEANVRLRCIQQLNFVSKDETKRKEVMDVYPDFFDEDFSSLSTEELLEKRVKLKQAKAVSGVYARTQNNYRFLSKGLEGISREFFGYEGAADTIHNLFQEHANESIFEQLGKIRLDNVAESSTYDKALQLLLPSAEWIFNAYRSAKQQKIIDEELQRELSPEEIADLERDLPN
jgi:hypothetical protein